DPIDYSAGVILKKKTNDKVQKDETLLELYYNDIDEARLKEAMDCAKASFELN
ncbi:pyrimidine-nucleoside phosphorylase, partial [bacterium]|nr:pyrimidine-nucleoside phosphorylase [bacterium]